MMNGEHTTFHAIKWPMSTHQMVASGRISVKGKISSRNSKPNTMLLPPKSDRRAVAAMGANATSVKSPRSGITSEELPAKSINKHTNSFPKSGDTSFLGDVEELGPAALDADDPPIAEETVLETALPKDDTCFATKVAMRPNTMVARNWPIMTDKSLPLRPAEIYKILAMS